MAANSKGSKSSSRFREWLRERLVVNPGFQYRAFQIGGALRSLAYAFRAGRHFESNSERFIFIVGAGRSGNTLLRKLMMERSSIYIPPESYVIPTAIVGLLRAGGLSWEERVDFVLAKFEYHPEFATFDIGTLRGFASQAKTWPEKDRSIGRLLNQFYFWMADAKGLHVDSVGDKTPLNTYSLGLLRAVLPHAQYVYIERDGVDVAVSYLKSGIYKSTVEGAVRWRNSKLAWKSFRKLLAPDRYCEIRYEDLVGRPAEVVDQLIEHLALTKRAQGLEVGDLLGDVGMLEHHENVLLETGRESIGKGRAAISDRDRLLLGPIINAELRESGYEPI